MVLEINNLKLATPDHEQLHCKILIMRDAEKRQKHG